MSQSRATQLFPRAHDCNTSFVISLHDLCPTTQHDRISQSNGRTVLFEPGEKQAHVLLNFLRFATKLVQLGSKREHCNERGAVVQFVRKGEGSLHLSDALIRKSNYGANHGIAKVRTDAWIVAAILKRLSRMSFTTVERKTVRDVGPRLFEGTGYH